VAGAAPVSRLIVMALVGLFVITLVDFERGYKFSDTQGGERPADPKSKSDEVLSPPAPRPASTRHVARGCG
jgi:hypothetical protein